MQQLWLDGELMPDDRDWQRIEEALLRQGRRAR